MFVFLKSACVRWVTGWKRRVCDHPDCSRWISIGHLKARSVGVELGDAWYCSYGCFYTAAQNQFHELLGMGPRHALSKLSMPLGLELVARGQLTPNQLRVAAEQQEGGEFEIGELYVRNGFVTEAQVTAARATLWGCPVYNPPPRAIDTGIRIPPVLRSSSLVVPMHYVAATKQLLLGFLRSVDYELMFAVENMTGCTAKACFIKPSDFFFHQTSAPPEKSAEGETSNEMIFDNTHTAGERARILCTYGAKFNAERVKITLCKNYLWARLYEGTQMFDLLFKVD